MTSTAIVHDGAEDNPLQQFANARALWEMIEPDTQHLAEEDCAHLRASIDVLLAKVETATSVSEQSSGFTLASFALPEPEKVVVRREIGVSEDEAVRQALEAGKVELTKEKADLVAEIAAHAGHLNHKQKIHYLSKLKNENDELKTALREAKALAGNKEN